MHILLLEDNDELAAAISDGLTRSATDHSLRHADTLAHAVKLLKGETFDVALVDLGLPDSRGEETALAIRTTAPELPVVVLSGEEFANVGLGLIRKGVQDFLHKGELSIKAIDQAIRVAYERHKIEREIRKQAARDCLTGLLNRREFHGRLKSAVGLAGRHGYMIALMVIDLDGFKQVNDSLGHPTGDRMLQITASRLSELTRASDCAARVGGDEFVVLLNRVSNADSVLAVAEKVGRELSRPSMIDSHIVRVSASVGIALFPAQGQTPEALWEYADKAMYLVKRNGELSTRVYSDPLCGREKLLCRRPEFSAG